MKCPSCLHDDTRVVDSRSAMEATAIRRRRECTSCGVRYTTYERAVAVAVMVRKRTGRLEQFQRAKLASGIRKACQKRPVRSNAIDHMVEEIEDLLKAAGDAEVPSSRIGELVCQRLQSLDGVAYLRFASVYKDFDDADHFVRELQVLKQSTR